MQKLIFPSFDLKLREAKQRTQIFDVFRNKYVVLTPEEWVRQHLAHYLVNRIGYPKGLMHIEAAVNVNGLNKRADIVIYNQNLRPWMICECKKPEVKLDQKVFEQTAIYNIKFQVPFLLISNGLQLLCAEVDFNTNEHRFMEALPPFPTIST
ncbi:MAG: type I restriction enzyme HsdR N-terminal domain-containing protein [Flavobacteriales bacterium]